MMMIAKLKIIGMFLVFGLVIGVSVAGSQEQKISPEIEQALLAEDWGKVAALLDKVGTQSPDPLLRYIKGHACLATNRNNESLKLFYKMTWGDLNRWQQWGEAFATKHPSNSIANFINGDGYARIGKLDIAHEYLTKAIEINNKNYIAWNAMGVVSTLQNDFNNAIADFNETLSIKPDFIDAINNIGMARIYQGQGRKGAIHSFETAKNLDKNYALAHYGLGCMEQLKERELAPEENKNIQKALDLMPGFENLFLNKESSFEETYIDDQSDALYSDSDDDDDDDDDRQSENQEQDVNDFFKYPPSLKLAMSAAQGDVSQIKKLIAEGTPADLQGLHGVTPLMWAVFKESLDGVNALLELGADPNITDDDGLTVIMIAAEMGNFPLIKLAIKHEGIVQATSVDGHTALMIASSGGNTEIVQYLITKGADVNSSDNLGNTALIYSSMAGQKEVVQVLLKSGADKLRINSLGLNALDLVNANVPTKDDDSTLHQFLQIEASDIFGHGTLSTALESYSALKKANNISSVLDDITKINQSGRGGITPLHWMLLTDNFEGFLLLLKKGANPNLKTEDGITAVFDASRIEDPRFLEAAIKAGGDPNIRRDSDGATPLIEAAKNGRVLQIRQLIKASADPNTQDINGLSPLHHSVINDRFDVTSLLLEAGADRELSDRYGNSPIDFANIIGDKKHLNLLSKSK